MITETIYGLCPSKSNGYKITRTGHFYKSSKLVEYEKKFFMQCKSRGEMIEAYFEIRIKAFFPTMANDLDGIFKIILDCLQSCKVIKNDNRAAKIVAEKFLDKKNPRVEIQITEIN